MTEWTPVDRWPKFHHFHNFWMRDRKTGHWSSGPDHLRGAGFHVQRELRFTHLGNQGTFPGLRVGRVGRRWISGWRRKWDRHIANLCGNGAGESKKSDEAPNQSPASRSHARREIMAYTRLATVAVLRWPFTHTYPVCRPGHFGLADTATQTPWLIRKQRISANELSAMGESDITTLQLLRFLRNTSAFPCLPSFGRCPGKLGKSIQDEPAVYWGSIAGSLRKERSLRKEPSATAEFNAHPMPGR